MEISKKLNTTIGSYDRAAVFALPSAKGQAYKVVGGYALLDRTNIYCYECDDEAVVMDSVHDICIGIYPAIPPDCEAPADPCGVKPIAILSAKMNLGGQVVSFPSVGSNVFFDDGNFSLHGFTAAIIHESPNWFGQTNACLTLDVEVIKVTAAMEREIMDSVLYAGACSNNGGE